MHPIKFLSGLALLAALAPIAARAQAFISLSPANVIGGSPVFHDSAYNSVGSVYQAGNIFNQQTGAVDMSSQPGNAWFPYEFSGSGLMNRFVTIDLGEPTVISSIEIFNSNQADRGTLNFSLSGGNSIQPGGSEFGHDLGSVVSSPVSLLGSTSLTYSTANPVIGQSFAISDPTAYRYLRLLLIDGQAQFPVGGLGLAEVRLSAVPEPEEYVAVTGAALLGFMVWRRRANR
jgi:hypothetical protein